MKTFCGPWKGLRAPGAVPNGWVVQREKAASHSMGSLLVPQMGFLSSLTLQSLPKGWQKKGQYKICPLKLMGNKEAACDSIGKRQLMWTRARAQSNKEINYSQAHMPRPGVSHAPRLAIMNAQQPLQAARKPPTPRPNSGGSRSLLMRANTKIGKQNKKTQPAFGDRWFLAHWGVWKRD